ncbi:winged helix DNA-binding domain-containing protein [Nonomuraea typhae]|uniref:winged helix DNA-binding domain-containing protein n=1 Tax=Nonomuraea typhae TaxID=2603600 RepID=UPI0012FB1686|nr:winged helix DNA-binding domain-containing protein [Nonomuraea typhae]
MRSVEAQLLHRPPGSGTGEAVRHLLAVQAQDVTAAQLALRARSATVTRAEIDAAVERREIVRAWGPRGTLHYIHHDDLPWLLPLTSARLGSMTRLAQEGVTGDDLLSLIERALAGQGPLTKSELERRLAGRARGQGIVHLAGLAAAHGLAVLGPSRDGKPTYVHTADWLGAPIVFEPDRERALAELAVRYRRAHVPATAEDLAAWSGVPLGEARLAWGTPLASGARPQWEAQLEWEVSPEWRAAGQEAAGSRPGLVRLLPAFDELLLGWKSRDPILAPDHARAVFPGGGILRPAVLVNGRIRGTWSRKGSAAAVELFEDVPGIAGALADEVEDVRRFLG